MEFSCGIVRLGLTWVRGEGRARSNELAHTGDTRHAVGLQVHGTCVVTFPRHLIRHRVAGGDQQPQPARRATDGRARRHVIEDASFKHSNHSRAKFCHCTLCERALILYRHVWCCCRVAGGNQQPARRAADAAGGKGASRRRGCGTAAAGLVGGVGGGRRGI